MSDLLRFPDNFDDHAWEVEAKGWFSGASLIVAGKVYPLNFYDPVRLSQEITSEHSRGFAFHEPNLVVVPAVTRRAMEDAAQRLIDHVGTLVAATVS